MALIESTVAESASVLIVDDNPLIVNVLKCLLADQQYQVYVSNDGEEALGILNSKEVDLIICDVMMPKMGGYELHTKVRERAELAHIPFIFLTALSGDEEINKGRESGADEYLVKPFDPKELLSIVKGKVIRSKNLRNLSEAKYESYRKKVIHTLSHEFRTPLVAINTGAELLLDQKDGLQNQKIMNLLEAIRRGGLRLERLVNDFMLLQQIEAGVAKKMYETSGKISTLGEVVVGYISSRQEELEKEGFSIKVSNHLGDARAFVYQPQIMDLLDRLLSNAVKFSPQIKDIEIFTFTQESELVIEVRDRGIGLDPARLKEAIDPFGQLDREKLEQQGGGLGLAIASRYAQIHSGRLEFHQREGGGSTVALYLPRKES